MASVSVTGPVGNAELVVELSGVRACELAHAGATLPITTRATDEPMAPNRAAVLAADLSVAFIYVSCLSHFELTATFAYLSAQRGALPSRLEVSTMASSRCHSSSTSSHPIPGECSGATLPASTRGSAVTSSRYQPR